MNIFIVIVSGILMVVVGTLLQLRHGRRQAQLLDEQRARFLKGATRRHNERLREMHEFPLAERIKGLPFADNSDISKYYEPTVRVISER
jgi:hypothetical protein